jgi:FtsX-like permease family
VSEAVVTRRARAGRRRLRWRARAPLVVAAARLRGHAGRAILVAAGIAASLAMLAGVEGGSLIARDRAVQRAVAALPASQQSFRVDAFGLAPGQTYAQADRTIRGTLTSLTTRRPLRAMFFRELRIGGGLVQLASLDSLDTVARLRSGRLPRTCVPAHCEVLELGAGGRAAWDQQGIHLVRVGTGTLRDRGLYGDLLAPTPQLHNERVTTLVASGSAAFDRLPAFEGIYRSYSWIAPLDPRRLHVWQIGELLRRESRAQAGLARYTDAYELSGPDAALTDARAKGRITAQRMVLIGGEVSTLLLGFALVCAIGLRRGLAAERRRLLERGARRPQLWLAVGAEVSAMSIAGGLVGVAAGAVLVAVVAGRAGLPAGAVLGHSLGSPLGIALVLLAWLAGTAAVLVAGSTRSEARDGLRLLDVAALGAAVAIGVGLARGGLNADMLATGGDATLLLLLPGLVSFVAAVAAGRLIAPLMRAAERAARGGPSALRLALLALARAPSRTVATAAFLLVSVGLALFAASYRATLERSARDEAAFAVPLDYFVSEGAQLVRPLDAAPLSRYRTVGTPYPVLRRSTTVAGSGTSTLNPILLGVPADALAHLHWRSDFSSLAPAELARRIGAGGPARLRTVPVTAGAVSLPVHVRGIPIRLALAVADSTGRTSLVTLGEHGAGPWTATARLPRGTCELVGLEVSLASAQRFGFFHREGEVGASGAPTGSLELGSLRAGRRVLTHWSGWVTSGGGRLATGRLSYAFDQGQTIFLRLPQPNDREPLRVVVSPEVAGAAGPGGTITLDLQDQRLPARIVGVAKRFPDADQQDEGFVVADESRLAVALDGRLPGTGRPGEVWLSGPPQAERELRRPPFAALDLASRRRIEHSLASDPLARGLELTLGVAALAALALAAIGLWLALVSELRDERGELFDLEAQGVSPDTLRTQFRVRTAILVVLGAAGGALLGLLLSRLVVTLVRVSAAAESPQPPLRFEAAWVAAAAGLGALVVAAALIVELTARRTFRGDTPERANWSLE